MIVTDPYPDAPDAVRFFHDGWDGGDPFGSAMHAGWCLVRFCDLTERAELIPDELEYRPGMGELVGEEGMATLIDEYVEALDLLDGVNRGEITDDDLVAAMLWAHRCIDIAIERGEDY